MKRWFPSWPLSTVIFIFWLLMADGFAADKWVLAAIVALIVPLFSARLDRELTRISNPHLIIKVIYVLIVDVIACNITVAKQVLGREANIHPGFIWVPLDITNIHGVAVLTGMITLTPGTLSASLSADHKYLLVHVLNLTSAEEVIHYIKGRYEAPLMKIFP